MLIISGTKPSERRPHSPDSARLWSGAGYVIARVQITPDGATAYVADFGAGGVTPVLTATNTAGAFIPTGSGAYAVGFSRDGSTAWVVDTNANNVVPVTVATGVPGAAVQVGNVPDGVTVTG
jgi:DNA-binding beta-propeller fold protein YncE